MKLAHNWQLKSWKLSCFCILQHCYWSKQRFLFTFLIGNSFLNSVTRQFQSNYIFIDKFLYKLVKYYQHWQEMASFTILQLSRCKIVNMKSINSKFLLGIFGKSGHTLDRLWPVMNSGKFLGIRYSILVNILIILS